MILILASRYLALRVTNIRIPYTLLKKFKGAHTLWQIAVKTDIPNFDNKIQKNQN